MFEKRVYKNIFLITFSLMVLLAYTSAVLAADVGYIFRKDFKIDQNIIDTFTEMGLSVELIDERTLPADFSQYQLIFVGDEKFRNDDKIPVANHASVVANYFHGDSWGLTDREGVSQLGSTSPLSVVQNSQTIPAYQTAFRRSRIAVPYYYLDGKDKAPSGLQIAGTQTTSSGERFGDVISFFPPGAALANGQTAGDEICFFGIIESDFWTPEAKELFKECVGFVMSECQSNSDCPSPSFTDAPFCLGDEIFQTERSFMCVQANTQGSCVPNDIPVLLDQCQFACADGSCVRCDQNIDCDDGNASTDDICMLPGTSSAFCENQDIACFSDADCGTDSLIGNTFCSDSLTISQDFETFTCNNPGTGASSCSSTVTEQVQEICTDICSQGACEFFICETDADCDDADAGTEDTCINPATLSSVCTNEPINCFTNSDCGTDTFLNSPFCSDSLTVSQDFETFLCSNPGTAASSCSSSVDSQEIEICTNICSAGVCETFVCSSDVECDDSDPNTQDTCLNPGTLSSSCTNDPIIQVACSFDSDCPADEVSPLFCAQGTASIDENVYWNVTSYTCLNPGTQNSTCSPATTQALVEDCSLGCFAGECVDSSSIACSTDSECGTDGLVGNLFCSSGDVAQNFETWTCNNPGTISSFCSSTQDETVIEICSETCSNGQCTTTSQSADIVINEFVTDPQADWDQSGSITGSDEWFELHNKGASDIDLTGWNLTLVDSNTNFEILSGMISANGYITILNPVGDQTNSGQITLSDNSGNLVDSVTYGSFDDGNTADNAPNGNANDATDECLARLPNGADTDVDLDDFAKTTCTFNSANI